MSKLAVNQLIENFRRVRLLPEHKRKVTDALPEQMRASVRAMNQPYATRDAQGRCWNWLKAQH